MSRGNSESHGDGGWGSKLLKVGAGGLYSLMSSNNSEHCSPFETYADDDEDGIPLSLIWTKPEFFPFETHDDDDEIPSSLIWRKLEIGSFVADAADDEDDDENHEIPSSLIWTKPKFGSFEAHAGDDEDDDEIPSSLIWTEPEFDPFEAHDDDEDDDQIPSSLIWRKLEFGPFEAHADDEDDDEILSSLIWTESEFDPFEAHADDDDEDDDQIPPSLIWTEPEFDPFEAHADDEDDDQIPPSLIWVEPEFDPFEAHADADEDDDEIPSSLIWTKPKFVSIEAHAADDDETPSSKVWTKPEFGWQKLNVDGSLVHNRNPRSAGCGGVLRDASGTWLIGFAQKLDPSYDIHMIELEAILKGMELASDMNVKKLVVESDRKTAVSMVKKGLRKKIHHPHYNIINRIRKLLFDPKWEVKVVHIGRTANGVANRLAGDARHLTFEYMKMCHSPPSNCVTLLQQDAQVGRVLGYY